jgi:hypothetical protein
MSQIESHAKGPDKCVASNRKIGLRTGVSIRQVASSILKLEGLGMVSISKKRGNRRTIECINCTSTSETPECRKCTEPVQKMHCNDAESALPLTITVSKGENNRGSVGLRPEGSASLPTKRANPQPKAKADDIPIPVLAPVPPEDFLAQEEAKFQATQRIIIADMQARKARQARLDMPTSFPQEPAPSLPELPFDPATVPQEPAPRFPAPGSHVPGFPVPPTTTESAETLLARLRATCESRMGTIAVAVKAGTEAPAFEPSSFLARLRAGQVKANEGQAEPEVKPEPAPTPIQIPGSLFCSDGSFNKEAFLERAKSFPVRQPPVKAPAAETEEEDSDEDSDEDVRLFGDTDSDDGEAMEA